MSLTVTVVLDSCWDCRHRQNTFKGDGKYSVCCHPAKCQVVKPHDGLLDQWPRFGKEMMPLKIPKWCALRLGGKY